MGEEANWRILKDSGRIPSPYAIRLIPDSARSDDRIRVIQFGQKIPVHSRSAPIKALLLQNTSEALEPTETIVLRLELHAGTENNVFKPIFLPSR